VERQFVVSLVLAKLVTWMRAQSGTSNLRALAYMDEVAGFVPPTAAPPAKGPILTLLKQARAYGVGLVLATQNPVDLDYKAMSNAGTWMIGRLQTERDKARVLEALSSAGGQVDIAAIDAAISALGGREFILHNTHDRGGPQRFGTRWAMSYLRGPLTGQQLASLPNRAAAPVSPSPSAASTAEQSAADAPASAPTTSAASSLAEDESQVTPTVAAGVPVYYVDPAADWAREFGASAGGRLEPVIAARVHLHFDETRAGVDHREEWEAIIPLTDGARVEDARPVDFDERDFRKDAPEGAVYRLPSAKLDGAALFRDIERDLKASLQRQRTIGVFANKELKLFSRVGETEDEFHARCVEAAHAEADREAAKLRDTFASKMDRVRGAIDRAEDRVEQYSEDTKTRRTNEVMSIAGNLLGAFLGGRNSASSIAKRMGRSAGGISSRRGQTTRTQQRLDNARDEVGRREDELKEIETDLQDDLADLVDHWDGVADQVERLEVGLERDDVDIDEVALAWIPMA
jgi:hypothetical protein